MHTHHDSKSRRLLMQNRDPDPRASGYKKELIRRLAIASGQVKGLMKMVEEDKYCIDILHQSLAVKEALSSCEDLILKNHLSVHVVKQMKSSQSEKAISEISAIYKLSKKK